MAIQSVDGLLVGGASLKSEFADMVRICDEAKWNHQKYLYFYISILETSILNIPY